MAPLDRIPGIDAMLGSLFDEAFAERPGRQAALNRLVEYVLVPSLPGAMEATAIDGSVLAALASEPGMSRARFAPRFSATTGATPMDYLTDWRIGVAQALLRRNDSLKLVAPMVGHSNTAAFTGLISRRVGLSPAQRFEQRATSVAPDRPCA